MGQIVIQGLALSGLYALVAVGFTMIFSVGRVLNLAHGAFLMLGGYVYYTSVQVLGIPKAGGFALALLSGVAFAMLTCTVLVRRLQNNPIAVGISTLILAVVIQALIVTVYGQVPKSMWPVVQGVLRYEGVFVTCNILDERGVGPHGRPPAGPRPVQLRYESGHTGEGYAGLRSGAMQASSAVRIIRTGDADGRGATVGFARHGT